ncbi:MAG: hypothetical protein F6J87_25120 [Spirulina sp. SIO3F2]|nr:hypothetical protein [Spirulina sp. SIO3F2]
MLINGQSLIQIIRDIERPYAQQEYDQRMTEGEPKADLGQRDDLTGDYLYLPPSLILPPSRNFWGEPYDHGFITEPDDPVNQKSLILSCICGITECWFLLAKITVSDEMVRWDDFQQFHRDWFYGGLAFTFERSQYDTAFNAVHL